MNFHQETTFMLLEVAKYCLLNVILFPQSISVTRIPRKEVIKKKKLSWSICENADFCRIFGMTFFRPNSFLEFFHIFIALLLSKFFCKYLIAARLFVRILGHFVITQFVVNIRFFLEFLLQISTEQFSTRLKSMVL